MQPGFICMWTPCKICAECVGTFCIVCGWRCGGLNQSLAAYVRFTETFFPPSKYVSSWVFTCSTLHIHLYPESFCLNTQYLVFKCLAFIIEKRMNTFVSWTKNRFPSSKKKERGFSYTRHVSPRNVTFSKVQVRSLEWRSCKLISTGAEWIKQIEARSIRTSLTKNCFGSIASRRNGPTFCFKRLVFIQESCHSTSNLRATIYVWVHAAIA